MSELINYKLNDAVPFKTASKEGVRCQSGGGQSQSLSTTASYGYTDAGDFKTTGYAPITKNVTAHNQCGGKRRKRKKYKSRKKRRKSRRKRRTKRRRKRRRSHKGGACSLKNRRKRRTIRRRRLRGGAYKQYGSNIAHTPSYSFKATKTMPWALGPNSISRNVTKC